MEKEELRRAILAQLETELELQKRAALSARDEATSAESKAEGQYDMRGQEAAYLAEGQARLAAELVESLKLYQSLDLPAFAPDARIALGAVVTVEAAGPVDYFIGPRNGGMELEVGSRRYLLLTPQSPLGAALLGKQAGATVLLPGRRGPSAHRIVAVC